MSHPDSPAPELPDSPPEHASGVMVPANPAEVASALAYGLRFDERGRPRRGGVWEIAAALLAEHLASQLERANFVVMRKAPRPPHGAE